MIVAVVVESVNDHSIPLPFGVFVLSLLPQNGCNHHCYRSSPSLSLARLSCSVCCCRHPSEFTIKGISKKKKKKKILKGKPKKFKG